jgi:glutamate/tyrosine decarboxylase-like PLP-dependent enzyme
VTTPLTDRIGRVARVSRWHSALANNKHLSEQFRSRYAIILAQLEPYASREAVLEATSLAPSHPRRAVECLETGDSRFREDLTQTERAEPAVSGVGPIVHVVGRLLAKHPAFDSYLRSCPPLEQTGVPLHPSRAARLVTVDGFPSAALVGLVWSEKSVSHRLENQRAIGRSAMRVTGEGTLPVKVPDQYALVMPSRDGAIWHFSANYGRTLEDHLRSDDLGPAERRLVLRTLRQLREELFRDGLVWQGFAPRNMFYVDGCLMLIDFEEVVVLDADPPRAAACLHWHRLFFGDCLTLAETDLLFGGDADFAPAISDDEELTADAFERALLGTDRITWGMRRTLLERSRIIEGRHSRTGPRNSTEPLFGHQLGHFWGDFVEVGGEARLFRILSEVTERPVLVGCLEVFEAAMEADICSSIGQAAGASFSSATPRTDAVIDTLEAVGAANLAQGRIAIGSWYSQVATDPGSLIDTLNLTMCRVAGAVPEMELQSLFVGDQSRRSAHEQVLNRAVGMGLDFILRAEKGQPFLEHLSPRELQDCLGRPLPIDGVDLSPLLSEVEDSILRYSISQSHPGYLAFPDSGNSIAALSGSVLSRFLNQNLIALDRSAPAATFVEVQVIEWLRELVGFDAAPLAALAGVKDVAGLWTTGGHLSNHVAMLAALGQAFPDARRAGLRSISGQPAVILAGPIAHYSHSDAAFHLGLGWENVLSVAATPGFTTDPEAVDAMLIDPPEGKKPFMVVGVAGNCRTTGLDDLSALANVCEKHGVWFHVDACHGGSLIFSPRLRAQELRGMERANSVALDPHKGLFTPYPSSYVLFRDRGILNQFSRHEKAVAADGCWDLGLITPFLGSRGFDSLATWMLLRHIGIRALGEIIEGRQGLVRYLVQRICESRLFVCLNDVDFYRVTFVFCPGAVLSLLGGVEHRHRRGAAAIISRFTSQLNTLLYQSGVVCFDEHTLVDLGDRLGLGSDISYTIMAACPGNPLLSQSQMDDLVEKLTGAAVQFVEPMLDAIRGDIAPPLQLLVAGPAGWHDQ